MFFLLAQQSSFVERCRFAIETVCHERFYASVELMELGRFRLTWALLVTLSDCISLLRSNRSRRYAMNVTWQVSSLRPAQLTAPKASQIVAWAALALNAIETNYLRVSEFTLQVLSLRRMYRIRRASRGTSFVRWLGLVSEAPILSVFRGHLVEVNLSSIETYSHERWVGRWHRGIRWRRGRFRKFLALICGRNCALMYGDDG